MPQVGKENLAAAWQERIDSCVADVTVALVAAVTVTLPHPLRRFAAGSDELPARGVDVAEVLASLRGTWPELAQRVLDDCGEPRRVIRIFLNGSDLRSREGLATPVCDGDTLALVIAASGG